MHILLRIGCAALVALGAASGSAAAAERELVFLNWDLYLAPEVAARFKEASGIAVKQIFFDDDSQRDKLLAEAQGGRYDLVCVSSYVLSNYIDAGWLAKLEPAEAPNRKHVDPRWAKETPQAADYAVPYFWGTLGIAYRSDKIAKPVTRWRDLYGPRADLAGHVVMTKSARDLVGMALKALGFSANSVAPAELDEAEALLLAQKPHVLRYEYVFDPAASPLVSGEAYAAIMFNGDAQRFKSAQPAIEYVVPGEGGNLWVDYLAVMAHATHRAEAVAFIDFLNRPDIAALNATQSGYASPNQAAGERLDAAFKANPVIYPGRDSLESSEAYHQLPPRVGKRYNEITAHVLR
jgi:spermidine/putrescine transport system substrate-binding protein